MSSDAGDSTGSDYPRSQPPSEDKRFLDGVSAIESVLTSSGQNDSGQNDSGLFETNLRDERYLPFEGAGAISQWRLRLPTTFPAFDHDTITDVILHLRYTARDGRERLRGSLRFRLFI